uniref:RNA-directed DNA polymerase, eukaryota n=1 Tax=Tanacetum cinerariifolium TaxID=118510 RepID=A0A699HCJ6_TANCI|nr:RNA-directed DNA polymerase, eukaryota [Tanacetum cinerariifolium]
MAGGVLVNGDWIVKPNDVKNEFLNHFSFQFDMHVSHRICLADVFNNQLSLEQQDDLERTISIKEIKRGLFTGISLDNSLTISHLFYADDAIFVGKWDSSNLKIILKVLKCFHKASGLKININKSKLMGYGVHSDEVETAARYIGCTTFVAPFSHLGVKKPFHTANHGYKLIFMTLPVLHMAGSRVDLMSCSTSFELAEGTCCGGGYDCFIGQFRAYVTPCVLIMLFSEQLLLFRLIS